MSNLKNLTIKQKLTVILMITSTAAVLLACCVFIVFSFFSNRKDLRQDLSSLAAVVGKNMTATLKFDFPEEAEDILKALGARNSIAYAVIHDKDGKRFATYPPSRKGGKGLPDFEERAGGFLSVSRPIDHFGDRMGTISLYDDMSRIYAQLKRDLFFLILVMVIALVTARLIAERLQSLISDPILKLAGTAKAISVKRDYSLRATKQYNDEVGVFIDAFNEMLAQIQARDKDLRRLRSLLKNIIDAMPSILVAVDSEVKVIQWNFEAEKVTGVSPEKAEGRIYTEIFPAFTNEMRHIQEAIRLQKKEKDTNIPTLLSGEARYSDVTVYPLMTSGITGSVIRIDDVTDRVLISEKLKRLNEELENRVRERTEALENTIESLKATQTQLVEAEKMASLGGLVAGVAHEINTPIGVSLTDASFLEKKTRDLSVLFGDGKLTKSSFETYTTVALQAAQSIQSNIRRAAELVQSFKQVAVDQSSEVHRVFKVKDYIEEILMSLHNKLKKKRHSVTINCPDDLAINSYPGAFSQIITNFIINTLEHGFEEMEEGRIVFDINEEDGQLILIYRDNGKGMKEEILRQVFEPFYTTKRGMGGTGLGMHIVYNLVTQSFGGTIGCESEEGKGIAFTIRIPMDAYSN